MNRDYSVSRRTTPFPLLQGTNFFICVLPDYVTLIALIHSNRDYATAVLRAIDRHLGCEAYPLNPGSGSIGSPNRP
jgi:hypothetical protein